MPSCRASERHAKLTRDRTWTAQECMGDAHPLRLVNMREALVLFILAGFFSVCPSCQGGGAINCVVRDADGNSLDNSWQNDCQACAAQCNPPSCHQFDYTTETGTIISVCPGTGSGDPHFKGFNGSPFEYHGHDGAFVNIYTDASLQVNAELNSFGYHGLTFMKSIGVKTYPPCNFFKFTSMPVVDNSTWIASVESYANGEVYDGSSGEWTAAGGSVILKQILSPDGSFEAMLRTPLVEIRVCKEHASLHLDLSMQLLTVVPPLSAHGILGQTLEWAVGETSLAGDETSYIVSGIFEDDFAFNMFHTICGI